jgi:hypothetical protein
MEWHLKDAVGKAVCHEFSQLNLNFLPVYAESNKEFISELYSKGFIDDMSVEGALETAVFSRAKSDLEHLLKRNLSDSFLSDPVMRPECLAYAIQRGRITAKELKKVTFPDAADTADFVRKYFNNDILKVLRYELLNPQLKTAERYHDPALVPQVVDR